MASYGILGTIMVVGTVMANLARLWSIHGFLWDPWYDHGSWHSYGKPGTIVVIPGTVMVRGHIWHDCGQYMTSYGILGTIMVAGTLMANLARSW